MNKIVSLVVCVFCFTFFGYSQEEIFLKKIPYDNHALYFVDFDKIAQSADFNSLMKNSKVKHALKQNTFLKSLLKGDDKLGIDFRSTGLVQVGSLNYNSTDLLYANFYIKLNSENNFTKVIRKILDKDNSINSLIDNYRYCYLKSKIPSYIIWNNEMLVLSFYCDIRQFQMSDEEYHSPAIEAINTSSFINNHVALLVKDKTSSILENPAFKEFYSDKNDMDFYFDDKFYQNTYSLCSKYLQSYSNSYYQLMTHFFNFPFGMHIAFNDGNMEMKYDLYTTDEQKQLLNQEAISNIPFDNQLFYFQPINPFLAFTLNMNTQMFKNFDNSNVTSTNNSLSEEYEWQKIIYKQIVKLLPSFISATKGQVVGSLFQEEEELFFSVVTHSVDNKAIVNLINEFVDFQNANRDEQKMEYMQSQMENNELEAEEVAVEADDVDSVEYSDMDEFNINDFLVDFYLPKLKMNYMLQDGIDIYTLYYEYEENHDESGERNLDTAKKYYFAFHNDHLLITNNQHLIEQLKMPHPMLTNFWDDLVQNNTRIINMKSANLSQTFNTEQLFGFENFIYYFNGYSGKFLMNMTDKEVNFLKFIWQNLIGSF